MAKLKLTDKVPPFIATVQIPLHGDEGGVCPVKMTFLHRSRDEFEEWRKGVAERDSSVESEAKTLMECVVGWELDDEFTVENMQLLLNKYGGASLAIFSKYREELHPQRIKN